MIFRVNEEGVQQICIYKSYYYDNNLLFINIRFVLESTKLMSYIYTCIYFFVDNNQT
jgi:hypothetical protein